MGQSGWALSPEAGGRLDVCAFQVTMVSSRSWSDGLRFKPTWANGGRKVVCGMTVLMRKQPLVLYVQVWERWQKRLRNIERPCLIVNNFIMVGKGRFSGCRSVLELRWPHFVAVNCYRRS